MTNKNKKTNGEAKAEIDLPDIAPPDPVVAALQAEIELAEQKCKRLDKVEAELSVLREKMRGMEQERGRHAATLEAATEERRRFAFAAADGDSAAQERLRVARTAQAEAALIVEDQDSAIAEGRNRFDALEAEQAELMPFLSWHEAMKMALRVLEESREIDVHLEGFAATLAGHQEKLERVRQLAQDSGREQSFRTVGIRQVMRVFSTRMARIWPLEFEKFSKDYQEKSYGQILRMQIGNGIGVNLDVEPAGEATEATPTVEATEANAAV